MIECEEIALQAARQQLLVWMTLKATREKGRIPDGGRDKCQCGGCAECLAEAFLSETDDEVAK